MLHVLRHYLPLRKALLIGSETILLTLIVMAGMSSHLWAPGETTLRAITFAGLSVVEARWRCLFSALMISAVAQLTISFNELYDFRISGSRYDRAARFLTSAGIAILLCIGLVSLCHLWGAERVLAFPGLPLSQRVVLLTTSLIIAFTALYLWRNLFHLLLRRSQFNERLMIIGSGRLAQRLIDALKSRPDSGYEIVAMLPRVAGGGDRRRREERRAATSEPGGSSTGNPWYEAISQTATIEEEAGAARVVATKIQQTKLVLASDLERRGEKDEEDTAETGLEVEGPLHGLAQRLKIDRIIVALEDRRGSLPTDALLECRLDGIAVQEVEAFYERITGKIPAEAMRPSYLIYNAGFVQHPLSEIAKRLGDFTLALLVLLVTWPLMVLTAIAIRIDSPGPILFRQERTGRRGKPFTLMKFRSMREDAEKHTGPVWAQEDDPRVTRVGGIIRRTRLDELPQLLNVLTGSMSMVGPRPERPHFVEELTEKIPYYHQRHIVKPGITGWAQINYPYGNTLEDSLQKLQYDLFYIKYQSTIFDCSILFNTVKTVVLRKGT